MTVKACLLGDSNVGKTSIARRLSANEFDNEHQSTIGASYCSFYSTYDDERIKVDVWDTAGQERFRSVAEMYYRSAGLILVVFSLDLENSVTNAIETVTKIKAEQPESTFVMMANKCDLPPADQYADYAKAEAAAAQLQCGLIKVSAKLGGIQTQLDEFVAKAPRVQSKMEIKPLNVESKTKAACC